MYGADIEFFIRKEPTGRIIPACGLIGGEKGNPIKLTETFSILEDGAAVELNYEPREAPADLLRDVAQSAEIVRLHTKYSVSKAGEAKIRGVEKFPKAMEIGCAPDFDAYGDTPTEPRKTPDIGSFGGMRFAGGHLHFSYHSADLVPAYTVARLADLVITIPLLLDAAAQGGEKLMKQVLGPKRSKFYGLPGLYRPKNYGMEYRTLSNYFVFSKTLHPTLRRGMANVCWFMEPENVTGYFQELMLQMDWQKVRESILNLNIPLMNECLVDKGKVRTM